MFGPSTVVSVVKPFIQLHRAGYISARITLESLVNRRDIDKADLVAFCRNTEPRYAHLLDLVTHRDIPFIYELDDNFFEIPLDSEFGQYYRAPERLALVTDYMGRADLVRVYSEPLHERARTLNSRVEKVVGPVDLRLVAPPPLGSDRTRIRLVYATSRSADELADIFVPALTRVLEDYAGQVEAHFWGFNPPTLRDFRDVYFQPVILNYDHFLRKFSRAGFDIGLAPLLDNIFYCSKTNNKFREYGACRVAGIYSNVDVYSSCVVHEETGLLVPNQPEAWYNALVRLIEDCDLRDEIKNRAREYVQRHYSQKNFEQVWWAHIQQVLAGHSSLAVTEDSQMRLDLPAEQGKTRPSLSFPLRALWKGSKNLYHLLSRSPGTVSSSLRYYWYTLWMLIRVRFLTSRAGALAGRLCSEEDARETGSTIPGS
jgi:glycosyltransferase involved in cell wall biosynthesis